MRDCVAGPAAGGDRGQQVVELPPRLGVHLGHVDRVGPPMSSSQVMECSKAATSLSGVGSARAIWAGASCCCINRRPLDV